MKRESIASRTKETSPPSYGRSSPSGAILYPEGVNFGVFLKQSEAVRLLHFDHVDDPKPFLVIELDRQINRTYHYWHMFVPAITPRQLYAYRPRGPFQPERGPRFGPAIPSTLMRKTEATSDELESCLNSRSGLLGVCGVNDMREVERQARQGVKDAVLGSVDAVVFTAGIGENAALVRSKASGGLERTGTKIDKERNGAVSGDISEIQTDGAPARILVVRTEEEREIAREKIETIRKTASKRAASRQPSSHRFREGK